MYRGRLDKNIEVIDKTSEEDNPYQDWDTEPSMKFIEELLNAGFTLKEIYDIDIYGEHGIIVDYMLYPQECLKYDDKHKTMQLKMKYPRLHEFREALNDLGIIYDEDYWNNH